MNWIVFNVRYAIGTTPQNSMHNNTPAEDTCVARNVKSNGEGVHFAVKLEL